MTPPSMLSPGSIEETTFVCCVEYGRLEDQTLLMLRSLRANGGALGKSRVLAVVGRFGASLRPSTVSTLQHLGVELVYDRSSNPAPWFNYANKVVAVSLAETLAQTQTVTWLDSDVLVAAEPINLLLRDGESFAGYCEFLSAAVAEDDARHVPYWNLLCALLRTNFDAFPTVRMQGHSDKCIRLNFNSGIFSWRRGSAFAAAYRDAFVSLLRSRIAQYDGNFFNADQVILAPILVAHKLAWRHLDIADHFMIFPSMIDGDIAAPHMGAANLLHYSGSLRAPHRSKFLTRLESEAPALWRQILVWEGKQATAADRLIGLRRAIGFAFKTWRALRWKIYEARVKRSPPVEVDESGLMTT